MFFHFSTDKNLLSTEPSVIQDHKHPTNTTKSGKTLKTSKKSADTGKQAHYPLGLSQLPDEL